MLPILRLILIVVGLLDLALISPALRRARTTQQLGRLVSTAVTLTGLVTVTAARTIHPPPTGPIAVAGLVLMDIGLTGYALWLPERGLLAAVRRVRRRGRGHAQ